MRTYVRDHAARSGIWFFTLDASRLGAVITARAAPYRLPYFWSSMRLGDCGNEIAYLSRRRWPGPRPATGRLRIGIGTPIAQGDITALEHFLTARWMLFSIAGGRPVLPAPAISPGPCTALKPRSWKIICSPQSACPFPR